MEKAKKLPSFQKKLCTSYRNVSVSRQDVVFVTVVGSTHARSLLVEVLDDRAN
jgi:hypothetical protein